MIALYLSLNAVPGITGVRGNDGESAPAKLLPFKESL